MSRNATPTLALSRKRGRELSKKFCILNTVKILEGMQK